MYSVAGIAPVILEQVTSMLLESQRTRGAPLTCMGQRTAAISTPQHRPRPLWRLPLHADPNRSTLTFRPLPRFLGLRLPQPC